MKKCFVSASSSRPSGQSQPKRIAVACSLLLALIIPASTAFGDDMPTSVNNGSKALLFTFSGLSMVSADAFNGGIGGKLFVTDMLALRASLQAAIFSQSIPANPQTEGGVTEASVDGSGSAMQFGINFGGEYHFLKTRVSPYVGATIGVTSTSNEYKPAMTGPSGSTLTQPIIDNYDTTFAGFNAPGLLFNVAAIGGVEFFIIKELSLSAEYQLGYGLTASYDYVVKEGNLTTTTKVGALSQFGITALGRLTLAFYF